MIQLYKKDKDFVEIGEIVASLETAKTVIDIDSQFTGKIIFLRKVGDLLNIGDELAFIGVDEIKLVAKKEDFLKANSENDNQKNATKKAIQLAKDLDVKLDEINITGIIKEKDVENFGAFNAGMIYISNKICFISCGQSMLYFSFNM